MIRKNITPQSPPPKSSPPHRGNLLPQIREARPAKITASNTPPMIFRDRNRYGLAITLPANSAPILLPCHPLTCLFPRSGVHSPTALVYDLPPTKCPHPR